MLGIAGHISSPNRLILLTLLCIKKVPRIVMYNRRPNEENISLILITATVDQFFSCPSRFSAFKL